MYSASHVLGRVRPNLVLPHGKQSVLKSSITSCARKLGSHARPFPRLAISHAEEIEICFAQLNKDYDTIARKFISTIKQAGVIEIPKTRTTLHAEYEGVFCRWAEVMHIDTRIYHLVLGAYEKLAQIQEGEPGASSLPQTKQIPLERLEKKVVDGVPMEKFHPHLMFHNAIEAGADDSLTVVLKQCDVSIEEVSPHFSVYKNRHPKKKKGTIAGFTLRGVREMLREQGYKGSSISLENLIKRISRHHKEKNIQSNFGKYEKKLLAIASEQQLVWWIPE
ncbi:MAG: hypothetical protein HZB10_04060 [Candidatus Yonathbacteria bacterium]|nr:hypothetical protein [Candidatus Yonathbacteria bacterium]